VATLKMRLSLLSTGVAGSVTDNQALSNVLGASLKAI
jgi:hypothetical protein